MKPDTVTCSFVMDRNVYNAFKSVVSKHGQNVKGSIVDYMQSVIQYGTPNIKTMWAIQETEDLKKDPNKKVFNSFEEILKDE